MGGSGRQVGSNWFDGLGVSFSHWWKELSQFAGRYGFFLLGAGILAVMGRLFGRDSWRWWKTRRRVQRVQRGEAQASDATLLYRRMLKVLRRRGIDKPVWLTPSEFARVLQEPDVSMLVEDLTDAYNELRFGGKAQAAGRMIVLLERLEAVP